MLNRALGLAVVSALVAGCAADTTEDEQASKEPAPANEAAPAPASPAPAAIQTAGSVHTQGLASIPVGTAGKH